MRTHRTCVFGYRRRHDWPAMSIVYYVATEDDVTSGVAEIAPHGLDGAVDSAGAGAALTAGINALAPQGVLAIVAIHTSQ